MNTSNPTLNSSVFTNAGPVVAGDKMTLNGTVAKTGLLTTILLVAAAWAWNACSGGALPAWFGAAAIGGGIGAFVIGLIISFSPRTAPMLAPVYALGEGVILGLISAMFERRFHGIVLTAVLLTCGVLAAMLAAYMTGVIRATEKFKAGVFAATGGICLFYLITMVLGLFGVHVPGLFGNGLLGVGISLFIVIIAALNLVIDFDFIERGAAGGAPKYMEWYGAFSMMVTLVWLYLEILRLLSKLRDRD